MADFRKWLLVLAVMVFAASAVYAQPVQPFGCSARQGGQVPTLRDGGLTELVGDVLLDCSGGPVGGAVVANFQIFMNTTVTNRVSSNTMPAATDAMLIISDAFGANLAGSVVLPCTPGVGTCPTGGTVTQSSPIQGFLQANLVTGDVPNTRNSVLFSNVVLPTGTSSTIRIANIRVVAPPASNSFIPTQVIEFVSTSPVGAVAITNATQPVGVVLPGLLFDTRTCNNSDAFGRLIFQQCVSEPRVSGAVQFNVRFREAFPTAFKTLGSTTAGPNLIPGGLPNTEHGLTFGGIVSRADTGTQLLLRFTNVPAGVSIYVSTTPSQYGTSADAWATLVSPTTGTTFSSPICSLTTTSTSAGTVTDANGGTLTMRPLAISGNTASATWEVAELAGIRVGQNPTAVDSLSFAVQIRFTANTSAGLPGLTAGTAAAVNGAFAPISTVDFANTSAPVPRFLDRPIGATVFEINPCVTNLLFPFVSNAPGFDTGIALVNTSLDNSTGASGTPPNLPFQTSTQQGTCDVYYFNAESADTPPTTPPQVAFQTTRVIKPGGMVAFALSQGGVPNSTSSAVGFQGYIIARCNFQYAHGYAFISDPGAQKFAHGYLALVIPDRGTTTRPPDPFTTAGSGSGEQLAP